MNLKGPELRAVLEINPSALGQAAILDKERERFGRRSLLHGIPVLLKDNIATNVSEGIQSQRLAYGIRIMWNEICRHEYHSWILRLTSFDRA